MNTYRGPTLWYMWSEVLDGFYQSSVIVAAVNRSDAIQTALQAFDHWVKEQLEEMWYLPIVSSMPNEDEFEEELKKVRQRFHEELNSKFEQMPRRGLILRSS